ncbi:MAG TPA: hypothetical protein VGJ86_22090 [Acidimicrobiales bacterium]
MSRCFAFGSGAPGWLSTTTTCSEIVGEHGVVLVALQPSTVCTAFVTSAAAGTARNPLASVALRSRANTTFIGGDLVEEVT